jgi:multidrug efflux pump subunit AcrB
VTPAPNSQDCGYQWAQQSLPELSTAFQESIQALQPQALANAFAFGENCMHADGTATFLPMETDFNITLNVTDISNESDLGQWIVKVMQVVQNIPPDQIVGPRPGRVTISFQSTAGQKNINFYIDQYRALQPGLSSADIYKALQTPQ